MIILGKIFFDVFFTSPRTATLTKFYKQESNEVIDEGIIIWFPSPKSYTGEDVLEFHVHGSRAVINSILETLSKINGCRIAEPGEFTKIALENGKINLLKAESIGDLIAAETEIQRRQAIDIMSGNHGKRYASKIFNKDFLKKLFIAKPIIYCKFFTLKFKNYYTFIYLY